MLEQLQQLQQLIDQLAHNYQSTTQELAQLKSTQDVVINPKTHEAIVNKCKAQQDLIKDLTQQLQTLATEHNTLKKSHQQLQNEYAVLQKKRDSMAKKNAIASKNANLIYTRLKKLDKSPS